MFTFTSLLVNGLQFVDVRSNQIPDGLIRCRPRWVRRTGHIYTYAEAWGQWVGAAVRLQVEVEVEAGGKAVPGVVLVGSGASLGAELWLTEADMIGSLLVLLLIWLQL